jgi:fatty acid/phospholipid biosynthesis enzyme
MQKILIDINHNQVNINNVIQGIKLYQHDEKTCRIVAVGSKEDMLTIKDLNGIDTVFTDKIYENPEDLDNDEVSLTKCFKLLKDKENKFDAFVCSAPLEVIKAYSEKYLTKISEFPTFICEYPNAFTGRRTALLDVGYVINPTSEELIGMQELGEIYTKKALYSKNFSFKLLTNADQVEMNENTNKLANQYFQDIEGYKGYISVSDIFSPDCKLVVGDASIIATMIKSTRAMFDLYENYINQAVKSDFKTKMGAKMMNSTFKQINGSLDKKFTSGGTALLGYDTNIVVANPTTNSLGFKSTIILAKTLIRCKILEEIVK